MSASDEVRVGQVFEHPLDRSRWQVQRTNPGQTKLIRVSGPPGYMWVNTPVLGTTWPPTGDDTRVGT